MRAWGLVMLAGTACGRIAFDPRGDATGVVDSDGASSDDVAEVLGCPADALLCDSFDQGFSQWTKNGDGLIEPASTPYRGEAVCMQTVSATGGAKLVRNFTAVTSGPLYARAFVQFPSGFTTAGETDFFHLVEPPNVELIHVFSDSVGSDLQLGVETMATVMASARIALDRWTCLELAVTVATTGGSATLSIDDAVVATTGMGDTSPGAGWGRALLGFDQYSGTVGANARMCFDEMIVARSPIGCARLATP